MLSGMASRTQNMLVNATRVFLLVIIVAVFLWYNLRPVSRVPEAVQSRTPFPILVPRDEKIVLSEWRYSASEKNLTFVATVQGKKVVFTQQAAPLSYRDDRAAYDRFIGTLKPTANFQSPLGQVSIFRLVEEESYSPGGDSAILLSSGTLLIAHPEKAISEDNWISLSRTIS